MKSNITGGEIRLWEGGKMIRYFDIFAGSADFAQDLKKPETLNASVTVR